MVAAAELADRAAYLPAADALICADLHIGRDTTSNVEFPLGESHRLPERVDALIARFEPTEIVLAGDVLHSFETVPTDAVETLGRIGDIVVENDATLRVVAGNHDRHLESTYEGAVHEEYRLSDGTIVCHGHQEPEGEADRYVTGHLHPAIEIEGRRHPCFLHGRDCYRGGELLVLPAFNALAPGIVVNRTTGADPPSPLVEHFDRFRPAVWDPDADETLWFPPLDAFEEML